MKQMAAATHMRHCSPPASCLANFTYSGVPLGGSSSFGPSLSKICRAKVEVRPCGGKQRTKLSSGWSRIHVYNTVIENKIRHCHFKCPTLETLVLYLISSSSIVISWSSWRGRQKYIDLEIVELSRYQTILHCNPVITILSSSHIINPVLNAISLFSASLTISISFFMPSNLSFFLIFFFFFFSKSPFISNMSYVSWMQTVVSRIFGAVQSSTNYIQFLCDLHWETASVQTVLINLDTEKIIIINQSSKISHKMNNKLKYISCCHF